MSIDKGFLTEQQWQEIVVLDYVMNMGYSKDYQEDLRRYQDLVAIEYGKPKSSLWPQHLIS